MTLDDRLQQHLSALIAQHEIVLFMKGSPDAPQCGFSATTVQILDFVLPEGRRYEAVDVLSNPEVRDGIKAYSNWPTIPQLYVKGEFIGGCDIVKELFASGELYALVGLDKPEFKTPKIAITEAAAEKLREALDANPGMSLSMTIDANFRNALRLVPETEDPSGDVLAEANGVSILFDPISARRADGLRIDYASDDDGEGLLVDNPNAPPPVYSLSVQELKAKLDSSETFELFDIRAPEEIETASIPGTRRLDAETEQYILRLDRSTPLVFICHHGIRSADAATHFRSKGFLNVSNVTGGIDAWAQEIDPSIPRY